MLTTEELMAIVKEKGYRVAEVDIYDYYISSKGLIDKKQAEAIINGKEGIWLVKDVSLEEINNKG